MRLTMTSFTIRNLYNSKFLQFSNQIKSNQIKCWFLERGENQPNPLMTPSPGIEPGTHWWKASALTAAPTLLPILFVTNCRGMNQRKMPFEHNLIAFFPLLPGYVFVCLFLL